MPIFAKARKMSLAHYNKGLKMANTGNLTGAIDSLSASLQINKKNIPARNLLGLCFYAVGRVGDALREWIISASYETKDNPAKEYLELFNQDMGKLEKFSEGLQNYNEALRYMRQHNEDVAAVRLKRAIEIIPNFVEALNLLTLLHLKNNDKMRAGALIERALAMDTGNPTARRFYRDVFRKKAPMGKKADTDSTKPLREVQRPQARPQERPSPGPFGVQGNNVFSKRSPLPGILSFMVGLGAMFLFMYVLVLPSFLETSLAENTALETRIVQYQTAHAAELDVLLANLADAEASLAAVQSQAGNLQNENIDLQNETWVNNGHNFLTQQMYAEALAAVENVDTARLSAESYEIYNIVRNTAMPVLELQYLTLGQGLYNGRNYAEARVALETAAAHITEGSNQAAHIFYFLGRIAENDGNFDLARDFYETIINHHPGTIRTNAANQRLNIIAD